MERTNTPGPERERSRMYSVPSPSPPASPRAPSTNRPRAGGRDQTTTGRGSTAIPHRANGLATIKGDLLPHPRLPNPFPQTNTGAAVLRSPPASGSQLPPLLSWFALRLSLRHQQISWRSGTRRWRSPRSCTRRRSHSAPTTAASRATRPPRTSARTAPLQPRRPLRPPSRRRLRRLLHQRCSRWSTSRGQPQLFLRPPLTGRPSRRRRGRRSTGATAAGSAWGSRGSGAGAASCSAARTGTRTATSAASTTSPSAGTPSPGRTPSCEPPRSLGSDLTSQIRGGGRMDGWMDGLSTLTESGSLHSLLSFPFSLSFTELKVVD
jgi:hypothetical protein